MMWKSLVWAGIAVELALYCIFFYLYGLSGLFFCFIWVTVVDLLFMKWLHVTQGISAKQAFWDAYVGAYTRLGLAPFKLVKWLVS